MALIKSHLQQRLKSPPSRHNWTFCNPWEDVVWFHRSKAETHQTLQLQSWSERTDGYLCTLALHKKTQHPIYDTKKNYRKITDRILKQNNSSFHTLENYKHIYSYRSVVNFNGNVEFKYVIFPFSAVRLWHLYSYKDNLTAKLRLSLTFFHIQTNK